VGAKRHTTALKTQACLGLERVEDPIPPSDEWQKPGLAAIEKSRFERNPCKRRSGCFIAGDHRADSCAQIASHRNALPAETHRVVHTVIVASEVRKKVESEGYIALPRVFYTYPFEVWINFRDCSLEYIATALHNRGAKLARPPNSSRSSAVRRK